MLQDLKIRMRWILNQHNLPGPENLTGDAARRWFLAHGVLLDSIASFSFSQFLDTVEHLELQQLPLRRQILSLSKLPQFHQDIELLKTVPGIADILAAIIVAEVAGFERFPDPESIACYTGLTERTQETAGRRSEGHISKAGSHTLRWALCEAAVTLVRSDPGYRAIYNRILKHTRCKAKAKVAMARKLICWLWRMVQTREPFRRTGSTFHTRNAHLVREQLAKRLASLVAA
jgi:transposase